MFSFFEKSLLFCLSAGFAALTTAAAPPAFALTPGDDLLHAHSQIIEDGPLPSPTPFIPFCSAFSGTGDCPEARETVRELRLVGHGERLLPGATTDIWVHGNFAYIGTFNEPCGDGTGENGSGVRIFDISDPANPVEIPPIPSVAGSRSNDIMVATLNSGDILVHSNEPCSGGPGGFEIWNVDDPRRPIHLARQRTDDINRFLREEMGFTDFGVHNLFLFKQGKRDFAAAVVESVFGHFQIFEITDPSNPSLTGFWGAEELRLAELGLPLGITASLDGRVDKDVVIGLDLFEYLNSGFGRFARRFLHGITVNRDGDRAYLSNWDAGLVLLDISDPSRPSLISVALNPKADPDGEVNSHTAWPSEDGTVVVETSEDFDAFDTRFTIIDRPDIEEEFRAAEGFFTLPVARLSDRAMNGPTTFIGLACGEDVIPPAVEDGDADTDEIAVIQSGGCGFDQKAKAAIEAGYDGIIVFNDETGGEALIRMRGDQRNIPGIFVGHSTGLAIFDVGSTGEFSIGFKGAETVFTSEPGSWGGVRIWDYSDPARPVLASTFRTLCSANPAEPACDPRGVYSVHDVIVKNNRAYFSWYSNGVLVLDISNPYHPVEIARFNPTGPDFEGSNGGIQDVWGVFRYNWKIFASDRNGGLYILD